MAISSPSASTVDGVPPESGALDALPAAFRQAAAAISADLQRVAPLRSSPARLVEAAIDGVTLSLGIGHDGHISEARHADAEDPATSAVMDIICRIVEGRPVQDAADHGAVHAIEALTDPEQPRPVAGILTPRNAGAPFLLGQKLLRAADQLFRAETGAMRQPNEFDRPYSDAWLQLDDKEKRAAIDPVLARFRQAEGIASEDLSIVTIDRYDRVELMFRDGIPFVEEDPVPYWRKPILLRRLEAKLRRELGERIEVFVAEVKDQNAIRRL